jgi:crossover junction endodeoxyribonuclease RuvC
MSIIIGLDPGSLLTGYGIIQFDGKNHKYIAHGVVKNFSKESISARLLRIGTELEIVFGKYQPQAIVVEKIFLGKNADSAFKLGHARGVALYHAQKAGAQVYEYAAREVKKGITGYGAAEKEQVRFLVKNFLKITAEIEIDAADALALAIYHSQRVDIDRKINTMTLEVL